MSPHTTITNRILKQLRLSCECELEELVFRCREFTWHDTLVELVRLSRAGQVEMKTYGRGIDKVRLCSSGQLDLHTDLR
jgi:hypothetical protein